MTKVNTQTISRYALFVLTLVVVLLAYSVFSKPARGAETASTVGRPMVAVKVLSVDCPSWVDFSTSYSKIANVGDFTVHSPDSVVEVSFNGRLYVGSFEPSSTGAKFELRVDNQASTHGRARTTLRLAEEGSPGVQASITGIFTGLNAGTHTVSMWVKGAWDGGSDAMYDPSCFGTDHVVIKEYVPFGASYLPLVGR